ncbi:MAG: septum formation initiator family protein [Defluviitaleaceae bacterium]|nr:septum formation initiator family protein [Defluviitaleaceae bacterium]
MRILKILLMISILILIVSASINIYHQYTVYLVYLERTHYLEARIKEETERNEFLMKEYENRFSDERVEAMARERLGLIRQNEILFVPIAEN